MHGSRGDREGGPNFLSGKFKLLENSQITVIGNRPRYPLPLLTNKIIPCYPLLRFLKKLLIRATPCSKTTTLSRHVIVLSNFLQHLGIPVEDYLWN